jgi:hypothetical protein
MFDINSVKQGLVSDELAVQQVLARYVRAHGGALHAAGARDDLLQQQP